MKKYIFLALAASLTLTSCSPFNVRTDYAETAQFSNYRTYKLRIDDLKLNDIDKDRVLNEISRQLQSKGLSVSDNPDLIINVKANHRKIQEVERGGYGMYSIGRRGYSSTYNEGALVIDLIDSATNKLVWQGIGSGISVDSPQAKQKEIPQMVAQIFAHYPPSRQ